MSKMDHLTENNIGMNQKANHAMWDISDYSKAVN